MKRYSAKVMTDRKGEKELIPLATPDTTTPRFDHETDAAKSATPPHAWLGEGFSRSDAQRDTYAPTESQAEARAFAANR